MYIYNVTINIDESVHYDWRFWIEDHINEVLETGKFISAKMTEVMVEEEMGGRTYSIQYTANSKEDITAYYNEDAERLRAEGLRKFADKMLAFRTELRVVKEFYPKSVNN